MATPVTLAEVYDYITTTDLGGALPADNTLSAILLAMGSAIAAHAGASGTPIVRHFPFTFNSSGLTAGKPMYTPTVGDILHDAWYEVDTAWNGTTPKFDLGTFVGGNTGFWQAALGSPSANLINADNQMTNNSGLLVSTNSNAQSLFGLATSNSSARYMPLKFTSTNALKIVVSQTGQVGGADPGATQGAAVLYLVTSTPQ